MKEFFEKAVEALSLGALLSEPVQVTGGLTHRMYRFETSCGRFAAKLLNPAIMQRPTALANYARADELEDVLKEHHISAVYALERNGHKLQPLEDRYFYVYEWFDGKPLQSGEITGPHCYRMGRALAEIHGIRLQSEASPAENPWIDWAFYLRLAEKADRSVYLMLHDALPMLDGCLTKGLAAVCRIPAFTAICHNDMDPKNVLWAREQYRIIDLECLGEANSYCELYETALCWSDCGAFTVDYDRFAALLRGYFTHSSLSPFVDWEALYTANIGRLYWLEYNLRRTLRIECSDEEERCLGLREVHATLEQIRHYNRMQDDILSEIANIFSHFS